MRRILGALTVVVAAVAVLSASDATARSASKPKLMVATTSPVVVIGIGFRPRESVRVVVRADESFGAKRATASATGKITMRFAMLRLVRCEEFDVAAKGDKGSSAGLHRVPPPAGPIFAPAEPKNYGLKPSPPRSRFPAPAERSAREPRF